MVQHRHVRPMQADVRQLLRAACRNIGNLSMLFLLGFSVPVSPVHCQERQQGLSGQALSSKACERVAVRSNLTHNAPCPQI